MFFNILVPTSAVKAPESYRTYCQGVAIGQSVLTQLHLVCNVVMFSYFSHCII